jgi:hypothetical protein
MPVAMPMLTAFEFMACCSIGCMLGLQLLATERAATFNGAKSSGCATDSCAGEQRPKLAPGHVLEPVRWRGLAAVLGPKPARRASAA